MKSFEKKLGRDFLSKVPASPGVYFVYSEAGALIYIGKAKNLRRRLGQYKNAKRRKKHRKMRFIVADAARIDWRLASSDLEACLLETKLIQEHRPKWNVAGAFYFLYPMIGLRWDGTEIHFSYTTEPALLEDFEFFGTYRSRFLTGEAFFSLMKLLTYVGHRSGKDRSRVGKYAYHFRFRQLPGDWVSLWAGFFRGESLQALEVLILNLVENAAARKKSREIQDLINDLRRFWKFEASPLRAALRRAGHTTHFVSQKERDLVFLKAKGGPHLSANL